jgi:hypothetical protein
MGNTAVAEDLAGIEELEELYELTASESEPEDDDDEDGDDEDEDGEDDGGIKPDDTPHE